MHTKTKLQQSLIINRKFMTIDLKFCVVVRKHWQKGGDSFEHLVVSITNTHISITKAQSITTNKEKQYPSSISYT